MNSAAYGKTSAILLALAAVIGAAAAIGLTSDGSDASGETSGKCGPDLEWSINTNTGALVITGTGQMYIYPTTDEPWGGHTVKSVSFPDGMTTIGGYAFYNQYALKSVSIPDSVTSVGDYAFYSCTSLESVSFSYGQTSIGQSAFMNCTFLESVVLPQSLKTIGSAQFQECTALESVTIPGSVTQIGSGAFRLCTSLGSVVIPSSVQNIGDSAFSLCTSLKTAAVSATLGTSMFYGCTSLESISVQMSIYDAGRTIPASAFCNCYNLKSIVIPSGITKIGDSAFERTGITSISMPDTVTEIGTEAFKECRNLRSVSISEFVTALDHTQFTGCTSLTEFIVSPDSETFCAVDGVLFSLDRSILYTYPAGRTGGYSVPEGTSGISPYAFYGSKVSSVDIPSGLCMVGAGAFMDCRSLESVSLPDSLYYISEQAFSGCTALTSVVLPATLSQIPAEAFSYCSSLTSVEIQAATTYIGSKAFYCCSKLSDVAFGESIYAIGDLQFGGCVQLKSITLPANLITIEDEAFTNCTALTSITLPSGLRTIQSDAFSYCTGLTTVNIPSSVNSLSNDAFYMCTSMTSFTVGSDSKYYSSVNGVLFDKDKTVLMKYPAMKAEKNYTVPSTVNEIPQSAFENCAYLEVLTLPAGLTSVDSTSFMACGKLSKFSVPETSTAYKEFNGVLFDHSMTVLVKYPQNMAQSDYIIPATVTEISSLAFHGAAGLRSVTIPAGVADIGDGAFLGCTSLSTITVDPDNTYFSGVDGVLYDVGMTELICYPANRSVTSYTVPETVRTIGNYAFQYANNLTKITLGKSIGNGLTGYAFICADKLASIDVVPENAYFKSFDGALYSKSGSKLICYPAGKTAETLVFDGPVSLGELALANDNLKSITFNGYAELSAGSIYGCSNLGRITFATACILKDGQIIPSVDLTEMLDTGRIVLSDTVCSITFPDGVIYHPSSTQFMGLQTAEESYAGGDTGGSNILLIALVLVQIMAVAAAAYLLFMPGGKRILRGRSDGDKPGEP